MDFKPETVQHLRLAFDKALQSGKLNSWETRFVSDMNAKFARYGTRARLTDKQEAKLRQVLRPYMQSEAETEPLTGGVRTTSSGRRGGRPTQSPSGRPQRAKSAPSRPTYQRSSRPSRRPYRRYRSTPWLLRIWRRDVQTVYVLMLAGVVWLFSQFDPSPSYRQQVTPSSPQRVGAQTLSLSDFSVTDGDTIQLRGRSTGTRLVGFNTPETFNPVCDRGYALGLQATARLKDLVQAASAIELQIVACACKPGTQGTSRCNFGRSCGILKVDGRDVGQTLISEGLAAPFNCGRTTCPPTPRPWCQ
ncbi:hypothetical protein BD830_11127 [Maritimibacter alkaliphilus HTCC2654]|nr:hypothetical protein BD830_11127 [Maritimibacter alkaliphilus HTCC2654]